MPAMNESVEFVLLAEKILETIVAAVIIMHIPHTVVEALAMMSILCIDLWIKKTHGYKKIKKINSSYWCHDVGRRTTTTPATTATTTA